jgi:hypothetical protein
MTKTFKLLRCHPKKTRKNNSCYDDNTILLLKEEWNKKNINNKITATQINAIWEQLKNKIIECENELCWLDKLVTDIKKKELTNSFAPIAPLNEWKKYNNWLSSTDFNKVMKQYMEKHPNFLYLGPSPIDFDTIVNGTCVWPTLCNLDVIKELKKGKNKFGIILNLDKHSGDGTHWVAMFIDLKNKFVFYFESTGSTMPNEVKTLISKVKMQCETEGIHLKEMNNMNIRHQYGKSECGMYCLYFIISLLEETSKPTKFLNKKIKISDKEMDKLRDIYFNKLQLK